MRHTVLILTLVLVAGLVLSACGSPAPAPAPAATSASTSPTAAPPAPPAPTGSRLKTVLDRGKVVCGVNTNLAGFGAPQGDTWVGFDADFCKALAAALFNDPGKVEWRPLSAQERFTAVQSGEVDVLFRNTTWTVSRDSSVGMDFGPTIFYDGQGFMTKVSKNAKTIEQLAGATICVQTGTTTELNLNDAFAVRSLKFTPVVFDNIDATYAAYVEGRCDAVTSDVSQLVGRRSAFPAPADHLILDTIVSKEPLGPAVQQNDSQWRDVVDWVVYATMTAEELSITSKNIDSFMTSKDPNVIRLLGLDPKNKLGAGLGLTDDFAVRVIRHVGNYGEIYDRNLGPSTPLNIPRTLNALWTKGGLIYPPPIR